MLAGKELQTFDWHPELMEALDFVESALDLIEEEMHIGNVA